jgi:hypothetical protein
MVPVLCLQVEYAALDAYCLLLMWQRSDQCDIPAAQRLSRNPVHCMPLVAHAENVDSNL